MNLHAVVRGAITTVNPDIPVTVRFSTGYATAPDGTQGPAYADPVTMMAQVQALTYSDLQKLDGVNLQRETRSIYLYGAASGISRVKRKGGDLITLADGSVYLVTMVLEQWPDWVKVAATLQDGS